MNDTINIEEAIETIKKQNKRIEELVLESEILHKDFAELSDKYFFTKSRIDKAIEYITSEETINMFTTIESREQWLKTNSKLLDILRGEDNE